MAPWTRKLYDRAEPLLGLPPADFTRYAWPWLVPGAPTWLELRWRRDLARAGAVTGDAHASAVGLDEIEEVIACGLCGEETMRPLLSPRDPAGRWSYHVVACPSCGLLYRHPGIRADRLGDLYAVGYSSFLSGEYEAKRRRRYELVMDSFAPLFTQGDGRRLLDFGCGNGLFLRTAHERGFDPYGVDLSPDSIEQARTHPSGRNTWCGAPPEIPEIAAGGFDVITMWSVLAHLPDPVADLSMLRDLLAPDGVLLLLTVNAESLLLKAHRDRWNGFTRNHLKFFSPRTVRQLFDRVGFGAAVTHPHHIDEVESGEQHLAPLLERRLRRAIAAGNRGNMQRALAFVDPDGPARSGLS